MRELVVQSLGLAYEAKLFELIPNGTESTRLEASGAVVVGDHVFVVLDNRSDAIRLPLTRDPLAIGKGEFVGEEGADGYEDVTYDPDDDRLLLLHEAMPYNGAFAGQVIEWNSQFKQVAQRVLPFTFESENKGFEGLAWTRRAPGEWLLALCEGNFCLGGKKGRKPGGGRIQLFKRADREWKHVREIALPEHLPFPDYSALALDHDRVGVVSQEAAMLWVGELSSGGWDWEGLGQLYEFPLSKKGNLHYSSVEGLAWLSDNRILTVTDKRKKDQPRNAEEKDQSIQVFDLP